MPEPKCRHLESRFEEGILILTVTEQKLQDEQLASALTRELSVVVDHFDARRVVVDLHSIVYISSVAFRPLLHLRRMLMERGGKLILCGLSKVVGDVFYTTRMVSDHGSVAPFEMEPDVPAAIARLNQPLPGI
jgi:anti-anti-sigma factor